MLTYQTYEQYSNFIQGHYTVNCIGQEITSLTDIEKYNSNRISTIPIADKDTNQDHLCFPYIFFKGTGGMYDQRAKKVSPVMYAKWILKQKEGFARRDIPYLFSLCNNKDIRGIDSGIFASLRTFRQNTLNAGTLLKKIDAKDRELEANLTTMFAAVRGTREYWMQRCGDLEVLDEKFGPATFFLTLSCAEYYWPEMRNYLIQLNDDILNVEHATINSLVAADPVSVCSVFEARWRCFLKNVIMDPDGHLGTVKHYFWRLEYQARGAPHIHMKLWIDGAPVYGVNSNEEVIQFIQKYITCSMPTDNQLLQDLVTKFQVHKCTKSCSKVIIRNRGTINKCRFGFPRLISSEASLNTLEETVKSRQKPHSLKIYNIVRKSDEVYINDYNPLLLSIWKANMDIQYVGEKSMVLNRYITTYVTKAEKNLTQSLWDSCNKNNSLQGSLKSFALSSFRNREVGAIEVAHKLLGYSLYESSDSVKWLSAHMKESRNRRIKVCF